MNNNILDVKKIGVSTNMFKNPSNIADLIGALAINFDAIEIEIENEFREVFNNKQTLEKQIAQINHIKDFVNPNLQISILAPHFGESCDIINEDEKFRVNAVNYISQSIEFASQISANKVTLNPGYLSEHASMKAKLHQLDKSLNQLNKIAGEKNINLLLINTGNDRPAYIGLNDLIHMEMCEKYSMVYLAVDLVHYNQFNRYTEHFKAGLKQMLPYVRNIHFADVSDKEQCNLSIGSGDLDYKSDLEFLVENGYEHTFIVEGIVHDHFNYQYLKEVLDFKNELVSKYNDKNSKFFQFIL